MTGFVDRLLPNLTESQRDGVRFLVVTVVLMLAGLASWKLAGPWWRRSQHGKALVQAREFARKNDPQNVLLALRRAIDFAPADAETWREAARILDQFGSEEGLFARQQVVSLAPEDWETRQEIFAAAVLTGRGDAVRSALTGLPVEKDHQVAFHRLAAGVSLVEGNATTALGHVDAWLRLAPNDADARFGRALLLSEQKDDAAWAAARVDLEQLISQPAYRVRSAVQLLRRTARRGPMSDMEPLLVRLLAAFAPEAAPDFTSPGNPGWASLVRGLQKAAASSPADVALIARWTGQISRPEQALAWIDSLGEPVRRAALVLNVEAELAAQADDLTRLDDLLAQAAWGRVPAEARVLAIAARTQARRQGGGAGVATWTDAVGATASLDVGLRALYRLALIWGDTTGATKVQEAALHLTPKPTWAVSTGTAIPPAQSR